MEFLRNIIRRETGDERESPGDVDNLSEEAARQRIVAIYTYAESSIAIYIREVASIILKYELGNADMAKDPASFYDIAYSNSDSRFDKTDQLTRSAEKRLLGRAHIQEPTKRDAIHKEALMAARNYWLDLLEKPNLSNDVWMFGQSRLAQISGKLERHSGSSEQQ